MNIGILFWFVSEVNFDIVYDNFLLLFHVKYALIYSTFTDKSNHNIPSQILLLNLVQENKKQMQFWEGNWSWIITIE